MCKEHFGVALALKVPVLFVVTKVDICPEHVLQHTLSSLHAILKKPGVKKKPFMVRFAAHAITVIESSEMSVTIPLRCSTLAAAVMTSMQAFCQEDCQRMCSIALRCHGGAKAPFPALNQWCPLSGCVAHKLFTAAAGHSLRLPFPDAITIPFCMSEVSAFTKLGNARHSPALHVAQVRSQDDVLTCARHMHMDSLAPIFLTSSVTGQGLDLVRTFYNLLPQRHKWCASCRYALCCLPFRG